MPVPADGTALYRIRGEGALLLYIGVSEDFGRRWKEHAKQQSWWGEMRSLSVDRWYESRAEAGDAEVAAILAEQPKYNKTHIHSRRQRDAAAISRLITMHVVVAREKPHWEYCSEGTVGVRLVGGNGGTAWPRRLTGGGGGTC